MRLLVTGGRDYADAATVAAVLDPLLFFNEYRRIVGRQAFLHPSGQVEVAWWDRARIAKDERRFEAGRRARAAGVRCGVVGADGALRWDP